MCTRFVIQQGACSLPEGRLHPEHAAPIYQTMQGTGLLPVGMQGPQLLLKVTTANNKGISRGFEATYDKGTTSFHLQKASVQESDSAVYYCVLGDTVTETTGGPEHKL